MTIQDRLKEDAEMISGGIVDITTEVEVVARRERNTVDAVNRKEERNDQSLEGDHSPHRHHHHLLYHFKGRRRGDESPSTPRRESIDIVMSDAAMKVTVTAMMKESKHQQQLTRVQ